MKDVISRKLPHGTIPFEQLRDPQLRKVLMMVNENMRALDLRLKVVEKAARESQRRG